MLNTTLEWHLLQTHYQEIKEQKMRDWFSQDSQRFSHFSVCFGEILLDYSKNRITLETMAMLGNLAKSVHLADKIQELFSAKSVNTTEDRPALHIALRHKTNASVKINGQNVVPLVHEVLEKMGQLVSQIHCGTWRGSTGKTIRDIVNIGIGGSHWGPLMTTHALVQEAVHDLRFHFISDVDSAALHAVLEKIEPEKALFIVSSKSFTTIETMTNAKRCLAWQQDRLAVSREAILKDHFIAVTAQEKKAKQWGIAGEHIFPMWDWVGGRYSIWSAIGLPLALQIGMEGFLAFLEGAYQADQHFLTTDWMNNIPVIMGLLSVWYINFFNAPTHAVIPYTHLLKYLRAYVQQLDMESNGKRITHSGLETEYSTGPIIWGELGIHGQHAFHQLLHQGTHLVPVDFFLVGPQKMRVSKDRNEVFHHDLLIANALSQAQALMQGSKTDANKHVFPQELSAEMLPLVKHKEVPGNRPSNTFFIDKMTPYNLGALLAFYEHKIFVQSVIWNVNPFDQWGVELGKTILPHVLEDIHQDKMKHQHDSSTENLILHYKRVRQQVCSD